MSVKVLIVDDEPVFLKVLSRLIKHSFNWEITTENCPLKAVELLDKNCFNILISDYRMPKMNGLELVNYAQQKYPEIKVLIISGNADAELRDENIPLMAKPFDNQNLIETVKQLASVRL